MNANTKEALKAFIESSARANSILTTFAIATCPDAEQRLGDYDKSIQSKADALIAALDSDETIEM